MGHVATVRRWSGQPFIAYYASAEIGCHVVLGWPPPTYVLDLFTEFRNSLNGLQLPEGLNYSLIGALMAHGLEHMDVTEKKDMRELVLRGGPWSTKNAPTFFPTAKVT